MRGESVRSSNRRERDDCNLSRIPKFSRIARHFLPGSSKNSERPLRFSGNLPRDLRRSGKTDHPRRAAGVLLPLLFRESIPGGKGQFVFQLIKRSSLVPQSGDLSLPGGMLHPVLDRILRPLLIHGPFPILRGKARAICASQQAPSFRLITLFLTNALRESWEEIGLSPARVRFLGPLPTYSLTLFRRTIFPLAGFVENPGSLHPNREVEKIVRNPPFVFLPRGCLRLLSDRCIRSGGTQDRFNTPA